MTTEDIVWLKESAWLLRDREPTPEELMEDAYWLGVFDRDLEKQFAERRKLSEVSDENRI